MIDCLNPAEAGPRVQWLAVLLPHVLGKGTTIRSGPLLSKSKAQLQQTRTPDAGQVDDGDSRMSRTLSVE